MVKEGEVLLKGGGFIWISPGKGHCYREGYRVFLFVPDLLDSS